MFGFFHPFLMLQWLWFVLVTDRVAFEQFKITQPKRYQWVQDHILHFAIYVQYRRLKWMEVYLFSETHAQLIRVSQCQLVPFRYHADYLDLLKVCHGTFEPVAVSFSSLVGEIACEEFSEEMLFKSEFIRSLDAMVLGAYKRGRHVYRFGSLIEKYNKELQEIKNTSEPT